MTSRLVTRNIHFIKQLDYFTMTASILAIGLDSSIIDGISANRPSQLISTDSCIEAINVLKLWDIATIVIDAQETETLQSDIEQLLSATPVTTQIVLITPVTNINDNQIFSGLGVKTITAPVSADDLEPFLC
jgi:hypothetical protein